MIARRSIDCRTSTQRPRPVEPLAREVGATDTQLAVRMRRGDARGVRCAVVVPDASRVVRVGREEAVLQKAGADLLKPTVLEPVEILADHRVIGGGSHNRMVAIGGRGTAARKVVAPIDRHAADIAGVGPERVAATVTGIAGRAGRPAAGCVVPGAAGRDVDNGHVGANAQRPQLFGTLTIRRQQVLGIGLHKDGLVLLSGRRGRREGQGENKQAARGHEGRFP
jgi:hypothetical protein